MPQAVQIDLKKMNGVFQKNFAQKKNDLQPKAAQAQQVMGLAGLDALDDTVDTICEAWPKVKPFLNMALKAFGFWFPSQVAMARALFTALDEEFFPLICKKGE